MVDINLTKTQKLMRSKVSHYSFAGQTICIGIDVHLRTWSVAILTPSGYKERFSQEAGASILYSHLTKKYPGGDYYSVYESGFTGFSTHYQLEELGIRNIIVNASDVPSTQKDRVYKTDKVDALKLATSLRDGRLRGIHILRKDEIAFREMVRYRQTIVCDNSRWKNRIKSYLYRHGITYPEEFGSRVYRSGKFLSWIKEIAVESGHSTLLEYLDSYSQQRDYLALIDRNLRTLCQEDRYSKEMGLLMSIPGIGFYTAVTFLSEVGDFTRIVNERQFAGFVGLVPKIHDSGEKVSSLEMTFRGNRRLRTLLIEASWTAIHYDRERAACYGKLRQRMNNNDAIVRIAHKILNRILSVMKRKEKYVCDRN